MTSRNLILLLCIFVLLVSKQVQAAATNIIRDTFNVAGSGAGFGLNSGVNTGINPPSATRLTGTAKSNLRYIPFGTKDTGAYTIVGNKLQVAAAATPGRFVLSSDGVSSFDFGPALGIEGASAANPVVYDLAVRMNNGSAATQRFSFGIATTEGDLNVWDFGVQIYRTNSGNSFYTVGKRIDSGSSGLASDINEHITSLTDNSYGEDLFVLIRVTDAGAETTSFNSRVQLSLNNGNSWIYDTDSDPDLPSGWRLNGPGRHIIWDVAGDAGPVTYDEFLLRLNPPASNVNTSSVFRVMAYNIHAAAHDGKVNTQKIASFILEQNVDLVALNEVARFMAKSDGRDNIAELSKQTGMAYVFSNNNIFLSGNDQFGNAILSKYPILLKDHRLLPRVGDNEQRGWLKAVVDLNGKFVSFWASHLDFHDSDTERLKCGTNFNTWLGDETLPVIFGGDFNDTPLGAVHDLMDQKWIDIWEVAGDGTLGRTVPCPGPTAARIDYIWKGKTSQVTPTNAFVGSLEASDHYSVLSQFIFNNFTNHATGFYFPFDQGSGTKVVDTIGGLSGSLTGSGPTWNSSSPTGQAGDWSLYFDGTRKITITDTNQIIGTNGLNDSYTIQAWVKVAVGYTPAARAILFQYERRPGFALSINTNRTLHTTAFKVRDISSSASLPNDGQWHHVAVVHSDGANMKFYIDGALAATVPYTSGAGYRTESTITIGSDADGANPFTGYLDRVRFDQRAMVPGEFDFPAVPVIGIRRNGNMLTLFWSEAMANYTLQANGSLGSNGWVNLATQVQDGEIRANITPTNLATYFRLKRP